MELINIFRKRDYFGIAVFSIALAMLCWFFASKILLFEKLNYQSDLFSHIQISRSWLQGRPLMFENNYGNHALYHNYFFDLLMGPLVLWWGAYGIFIMQFGLYVWALCYTFPVIYSHAATVAGKINIAVFYLALFCGPYSFWLYDDPWFGFHTEMLYIPLGFIFAVALYHKNRLLSVISAILIISIKEDGAVMAACIHLLYLALQKTAGNSTQKQWLKKSLLWGGIYILVFIAGIIYLKYKNGFGEDRLAKALAKIGEETPQVQSDYFISVFGYFGSLLLPLAGILIYFKQLKPAVWLWWLVLLVPLIIVNLISGFIYFPQPQFSLAWVPRFSLTFALFLALAAYGLMLFPNSWLKSAQASVVLGIIAVTGLFYIQQKHLQNQKYSFSKSSLHIFTQPHPRTEKPYIRQLEAMAKVLPHDYPVAPPYWLLSIFHKHDYIWITSAYHAWQKPRMVICDETRWPEAEPLKYLQQPDSVITPGVVYYFEREDRYYLIEAGIVEN